MGITKYQCMSCDGIYKTEQRDETPMIAGEPDISHGYCSKNCFTLYLNAINIEEKEIQELTKGSEYECEKSVNPTTIEKIIEKLKRNK